MKSMAMGDRNSWASESLRGRWQDAGEALLQALAFEHLLSLSTTTSGDATARLLHQLGVDTSRYGYQTEA